MPWYEVIYWVSLVVTLACLAALLLTWLLTRVRRPSQVRKMKVKVLRAENGVIDLCIDGVSCTYLASRPEPLGSRDVGVLRNMLDNSFLEAMCLRESSAGYEHPITRLWSQFTFRLRRREHPTVAQAFGVPAVGRYISENGIAIDIEGTVYTVVPPELLEALERGELDGQV